ncbi:S49 family peptidase [Leptothrix sp. BB-4]
MYPPPPESRDPHDVPDTEPASSYGAAPPAPSAVGPDTVPPAPARSASEVLLEQFAHDYLKDRRSTQRWNRAIRLGWLAAFIALVWGFLTQNSPTSPPSGPHTALVELRGEIAADTAASAEVMLSGLKSAFEDTGARAVVIRINSPGGSPVQAGIIHDELKRLKALHDKPIYVVVEESCASGAYYVAAAADEIYVDKASIVGSIGVLMDGFGFTGLMDKLGVERRLITAGSNKGMLDPFSPASERQRALAQAMIDQIHQQFIDVVRKGRGDRLKENEDTFSGLFWNGEEAVKLGLADGLGNLDYVAREVVKAENIIDYTPHENVAERLAKRFGASVGAGAVRAMKLDGLRLN